MASAPSGGGRARPAKGNAGSRALNTSRKKAEEVVSLQEKSQAGALALVEALPKDLRLPGYFIILPSVLCLAFGLYLINVLSLADAEKGGVIINAVLLVCGLLLASQIIAAVVYGRHIKAVQSAAPATRTDEKLVEAVAEAIEESKCFASPSACIVPVHPYSSRALASLNRAVGLCHRDFCSFLKQKLPKGALSAKDFEDLFRIEQTRANVFYAVDESLEEMQFQCSCVKQDERGLAASTASRTAVLRMHKGLTSVRAFPFLDTELTHNTMLPGQGNTGFAFLYKSALVSFKGADGAWTHWGVTNDGIFPPTLSWIITVPILNPRHATECLAVLNIDGQLGSEGGAGLTYEQAVNALKPVLESAVTDVLSGYASEMGSVLAQEPTVALGLVLRASL